MFVKGECHSLTLAKDYSDFKGKITVWLVKRVSLFSFSLRYLGWTVLYYYCNVCEALICKLIYLFIVFGEHGRYIGNINHFW